ncbi:MAG: hypothetical protein HZA46_02415 [Planctomycetales bacterium]|nr:hypothetical protein [Planctomycetales bacterium]
MRTVMLGSDSSREPLDELIRQAGSDEVEIVDRNGGVVAYLVPTPQPGDPVYATFEQAFLSDSEELLRRQASQTPGRTTDEILERLRSASSLTEQSCDTP